jgi:hypothetical protein
MKMIAHKKKLLKDRKRKKERKMQVIEIAMWKVVNFERQRISLGNGDRFKVSLTEKKSRNAKLIARAFIKIYLKWIRFTLACVSHTCVWVPCPMTYERKKKYFVRYFFAHNFQYAK